ncbi:hypothetical protein [Bradyrhizobium sp. Cp5.3]|uniref:hypothetical protein n=1 Tax=Bradyrhizobium sp. Cp5.3 TaxID=443598 RepID=UPI0018DDEF04|nr:hypothetical protein [Bradyrhizobium sp. Cp5.3]
MNKWSYSMPTEQLEAKPNSRPAPTVPPQRVFAAVVDWQPSRKVEDPEFVADDRSVTFHIEQHVISGIADLAREQAECINLGFILDACEGEVAVGALEIGPVPSAPRPPDDSHMYFDYDILHFQNYARSGPGSSTNADGQDYRQVVGEDFIHRRQQATDVLIGALARDELLSDRYREETSILIAGQRYTM